MRQLRLVPSGVQSYYRDTIAATTDAFAYSSTMALHIFRLKDNTLHKMIAAHERAISAICWCPQDSNLLASCSVSGRVAIWDLESEEEAFATKLPEQPELMDWAPVGDKIVLALHGGEVRLWDYKEPADKGSSKVFSLSSSLHAKVLRFHPRSGSRILVGVSDGSLLVHDMASNKRVTITGKAKTSKDPVTDAQWDPLSDDYLLAAFGDGSLVLFDVSTQREVHSFDKQTQGIKSLAWAKAQPGNFVTCTDRVGVLKLWNVSQRAPLAQIKVGPTGVNCVKAIPSEPNFFVLSFKNSAVGVCDIASRTMRFTSSPGHSETIFDVVFHPDDPDMLATASYDGHLKIWRISTMESVREMYAGKDQLLYGLAFGPGASRVCAVSNTGFLIVWRTDTGEQLMRQQIHQGQAYRCEWNTRGRMGEIAVGGADGMACVVDFSASPDNTTGNVIHRIAHPGAVIGVCWHPSQEGILATACQDGMVRIFNISAGLASPVNATEAAVTLQGHAARVFNIAFHPVCPNVIASGSDDKTIRVWNWHPSLDGGQRELRKLVGHMSYVRGLLWHSELPGILFSGSWDATIRVWDVVTGRCLHVAYEHHADVYGIALHPQRPFLLCSSSRDTTLRFWIFEDLVRPMLVQALVQPERLNELLGTGPEEVMALMLAPPDANSNLPPVRLYGQAGRNLAASVAAILSSRPSDWQAQVYRKIISFFIYRIGIEDLWGLLAKIRNEALASGDNTKTSIFHEQELIQCQTTKALQLASTRAAIGVVGKQEERLLKAAQIMLRIGNLEQYCRFMAQAGQWERAICIAPAVSREFWAELCNDYMDTLSATTDLEEAAPFWVATGRSGRLVDAYIDRSELENAFVVAKADSDGLFPAAPASTAGTGVARPPPAPDAREKLEGVASVLASKYSAAGEPLQAAMCFLAVASQQNPGPAPRAVSCLSRSHEVVLAFVVGDLLGQQRDSLVLKQLAQCAERDGRWETAAALWRQHPQGPSMHVPLLAARCPDKESARAWASWTPEQHQEQLAQVLTTGDRAAAALHAVCAGGAQNHQRACQLAVSGLYTLFARPGGWSMEEARQLLDPLESIVLQEMTVKDISGTLACAAYVGLVEASTLGYSELMFPLAQTLRNIITHQNLQFPVSLADITFLEATTIAQRNPQGAIHQLTALLASPDCPMHLREPCEQHIAQLQQQPAVDERQRAADGPGLAKLAGGHLPACYKRYAKTSVLTNQLIRGPTFELEDQRSSISLPDALAWARVNSFSPLNTGCKITPV